MREEKERERRRQREGQCERERMTRREKGNGGNNIRAASGQDDRGENTEACRGARVVSCGAED